MSAFNRFGATANDVLRLLRNVGIADLAAIDTTGTAVTGADVVAAALDWSTGQIVSWMQPAHRNLFRHVELELVETYATQGQTTVTLSLKPVAGTPRVYVDVYRPNNRPFGDGVSGTFVAATGVFTFAEPLNAGNIVYASYEPDADNAAFDLSGLSEWVAIGAAAHLGGRLYGEQSPEWALIGYYRSLFFGTEDTITGPHRGVPGVRGDLKAGSTPPDIARMQFYDDIEGAKTIGTVRKGRA
jgi:hypothetical protein